MGLFKTFYYSLFEPKELRNYNKRSVFKSIIYLLFLGIILLIPHIPAGINKGIISHEMQSAIRDLFRNEEDDFPCEIKDYKLVCEEDFTYNRKITSTVSLYIGKKSDGLEKSNELISTETVIMFLEDGVYINSMLSNRRLFLYSDYEKLENLNFDDAFNDETEFWETIFEVYHDYYEEYHSLASCSYFIVSFFQGLSSIVIFSLLVTLFNRFGGKAFYSFAGQWRISLHGMTGYVLGGVFSSVFGMGLLYYVGLIWSLIVCMKSTQRVERGE